MSLSPSTLLAIQQAGQSLHAARQAVADAVRVNGERVLAFIASQPFRSENDLAYTQLRSVARLAHELQAMEEQLKGLYALASELVKTEMPVLVALPDDGGRSRYRANDKNEGAEDAIVKPAPKTPLKGHKTRSARLERLSPNDQKVFGYLQSVLDRRSWKSLTQSAISRAAGIPLGSVGLALRRLVVVGKLRTGTRGTYRLS